MTLLGDRVALEPISPALAHRIVARDERPGDDWHPEYPFVDELDPLRSLAAESTTDPDGVGQTASPSAASGSSVRRTTRGPSSSGTAWFPQPEERDSRPMPYAWGSSTPRSAARGSHWWTRTWRTSPRNVSSRRTDSPRSSATRPTCSTNAHSQPCRRSPGRHLS
jgi:hypothetical protein